MNILEPTHIMLILVVALIVFGPDKFPGIAKGLGKATREYKKAYRINSKMRLDSMIHQNQLSLQ